MQEFLEVDRGTTARNRFQSRGRRRVSAVSTELYSIYFQLVGRMDLLLCQRAPIPKVPVGRNQCKSLEEHARETNEVIFRSFAITNKTEMKDRKDQSAPRQRGRRRAP